MVAFDCHQECKWVLNSDCSFYICTLKDHFTDYQIFDRSRVMISNNALCRVIGIRNVKLKMHDGFVYKLKQVRHFLDLKMNLISLGMIDQIRCVVKV